ncbi:hypothetical protein FEZ60_29945 [Rhodococcus sp. MS16]|uniref:hypothetical protein n=1 Tax=Rhodococcus sp. MS16 TaxID=2579941 RepID=UPI0015626595|nr:hypothetical protein [Rhodococcus sp. MS16]NRI69748.1 hypothetical protein [Rhodococcus sp. MS16]
MTFADLDGDELWSYLQERSGLPGPRANLALMLEFARGADSDDILQAVESEDEYIRCCGIVGFGFILVRSRDEAVLDSLTEATTSASWRAREAAAMAVQAIGDTDPELFRAIIEQWARSTHPLTLRAAAAGICEPRLLKDKTNAVLAVRVCRDATEWIVSQPADSRRDADTRALRQALGYCWSVAVAADPENALPAFVSLEASDDTDVVWIVRENRKKARLRKVLET